MLAQLRPFGHDALGACLLPGCLYVFDTASFGGLLAAWLLRCFGYDELLGPAGCLAACCFWLCAAGALGMSWHVLNAICVNILVAFGAASKAG